MIIGITGTLSAGKGTIVEYLKKRGFKHYSMSGFITEEIIRREMPINRDSMVAVANDLRAKYGSGYIANELYNRAKKSKSNVVIESLRTPKEIEVLKQKDEFYLFAIDANQSIRYSRAKKRQSIKDFIDFETFALNEKREMLSEDDTKQNILKCIELSDYSFTNNTTIEDLYLQLDSVLKKIQNSKPRNAISWDEYFMGIAILSSQRSKDPSTQVGACIVDEDKRIVGTGYNGATRGFDDNEFPWSRKGDFLNTKYAFVCHAELNAILNSTKESLKGCSLYVTLFPCNECAKAIIQSGIKKIIYMSNKYKDTDSYTASKKMLKMAGVESVKFESNINMIKLDFKNI